jgi:hypothetical protein
MACGAMPTDPGPCAAGSGQDQDYSAAPRGVSRDDPAGNPGGAAEIQTV